MSCENCKIVEAERDATLDALDHAKAERGAWRERADKAEAERDEWIGVAEKVAADYAEAEARVDRIAVASHRYASDRTDLEQEVMALEARAEKAEAEGTSLREQVAERAGTERVEWGVRWMDVKGSARTVGQIESGGTLPNGTVGQFTEDIARYIAGSRQQVVRRTVTEFAPVVSPWVAVGESDGE